MTYWTDQVKQENTDISFEILFLIVISIKNPDIFISDCKSDISISNRDIFV